MQHTAIVTGGLSGIGRAIAQLLQKRGDFVVIFDRLDPADAQGHVGAAYIQVDISNAEGVSLAFKELDRLVLQRNLPPVGILINNAGITQDGLALRIKEASWDAVLDVNLKGSFLCAQQALMRMVKNPVSYIIFMSSIVGVRGNPGQANYAASKAGVIGLANSLAREYAGRNILVNTLAPGFISTPMTDKLSEEQQAAILEHIPLKRFGSTADIAALVGFLTSGDADYITGQVIEVTGGM